MSTHLAANVCSSWGSIQSTNKGFLTTGFVGMAHTHFGLCVTYWCTLDIAVVFTSVGYVNVKVRHE